MSEIKVIGWDLDQTLGQFSSIARKAQFGDEIPENANLGLRPGAAEALCNLRKAGFLNVLTTTAGPEYAQEVLIRAGIAKFFAGIFTKPDINVGFGKNYKQVTDKFGISPKAAAGKLIVTGDLEFDQPIDLDGVVFVHDPLGYKHDARYLERLVKALEYLGNQNFNLGFYRLMRCLQGEDQNLLEKIQEILNLGQEYSLLFKQAQPNMEYQTEHNPQFLVPKIQVIDNFAT